MFSLGTPIFKRRKANSNVGGSDTTPPTMSNVSRTGNIISFLASESGKVYIIWETVATARTGSYIKTAALAHTATQDQTTLGIITNLNNVTVDDSTLNGTYYIKLAMEDTAGNVQVNAVQLTKFLDNIPPILSNISRIGSTITGTASEAGNTWIIWEVGAPVRAGSYVKSIAQANAAIKQQLWTGLTTGNNSVVVNDSSLNGTYIISLAMEDLAGNMQINATQITTTIDSVPPILSNATLVGNTITATASESSTAYLIWEVNAPIRSSTYVKDAALTNSAIKSQIAYGITANNNTIVTDDSALSGSFVLSIALEDLANNLSNSVVQISYTIDNTPPILTNLIHTSNTIVAFASEPGKVYITWEDTTAPSRTGAFVKAAVLANANALYQTTTGLVTGNNIISIDESSLNGYYKISMAMEDLSNNIQTTASQIAIVVDNTIPIFSDVSRNSNTITGIASELGNLYTIWEIVPTVRTGTYVKNAVAARSTPKWQTNLNITAGSNDILIDDSSLDGTYYIKTAMEDLAGNIQDIATSITSVLDNTPPILSNTSRLGNEITTVTNKPGTVYMIWEVGAPSRTGAYVKSTMLANTAVMGREVSNVTTGTNLITVNDNTLIGDYVISMAMEDLSNNIQTTSSQLSVTLTGDITPPTINNLYFSAGTAYGLPSEPGRAYMIWETDPTSRTGEYVKNAAKTHTAALDYTWENIITGNNFITVDDSILRGTYYIKVAMEDSAYNLQVGADQIMVTDTTPPIMSDESIAGLSVFAISNEPGTCYFIWEVDAPSRSGAYVKATALAHTAVFDYTWNNIIDGTNEIEIDYSTVPTGRYTISMAMEDLAGNIQTTARQVTVDLGADITYINSEKVNSPSGTVFNSPTGIVIPEAGTYYVTVAVTRANSAISIANVTATEGITTNMRAANTYGDINGTVNVVTGFIKGIEVQANQAGTININLSAGTVLTHESYVVYKLTNNDFSTRIGNAFITSFGGQNVTLSLSNAVSANTALIFTAIKFANTDANVTIGNSANNTNITAEYIKGADASSIQTVYGAKANVSGNVSVNYKYTPTGFVISSVVGINMSPVGDFTPPVISAYVYDANTNVISANVSETGTFYGLWSLSNSITDSTVINSASITGPYDAGIGYFEVPDSNLASNNTWYLNWGVKDANNNFARGNTISKVIVIPSFAETWARFANNSTFTELGNTSAILNPSNTYYERNSSVINAAIIPQTAGSPPANKILHLGMTSFNNYELHRKDINVALAIRTIEPIDILVKVETFIGAVSTRAGFGYLASGGKNTGLVMNHYSANSGIINLQLFGDISSANNSTSIISGATDNTSYYIRMHIAGNTIQGRGWANGAAEGNTWVTLTSNTGNIVMRNISAIARSGNVNLKVHGYTVSIGGIAGSF